MQVFPFIPVSPNSQPGTAIVTMELGRLVEVMSWVMGFGRHAEVLEPEHLRQAVAEELAVTAGRYMTTPLPGSVSGPGEEFYDKYS